MHQEIVGLRWQLDSQRPVVPTCNGASEGQGGNHKGLFNARLKLEKPPTFDGNPSQLFNWTFFVTQYLDILGVTDDKLRAKYAVALFEGNALTWWCGMSGDHTLDSLTCHDLCTFLEDKLQDIDHEMKLRMRIQELRHTESNRKYANAF